MMKKNKNTRPAQQAESLLKLLSKGQFSDVEKLLINHPHLRRLLLNMPGLRHTPFYRKRITFYKNFAKQHGMLQNISCKQQDKDTLRNAFAHSHCPSKAITSAAKQTLKSFFMGQYGYKAKRAKLFAKLKPY